jgi:hypothetical protein
MIFEILLLIPHLNAGDDSGCIMDILRAALALNRNDVDTGSIA